MPAELLYWAERAGAALLFAALVGVFAGRLPRLLRFPGVVAITAAAALVRINERTLIDFLFSYTGALSAASFLLLGWGVWRAVRWRPPRQPRRYGFGILSVMLLALAFVLYPPVLGVGPFDPYRYGFAGWQLPLGLLILLALGFVFRAFVVAVWLGLSAALFLSGLHPSLNLWDSLIDPLAAAIALFVLPASLWASLFRRRGGAPTTA